MPVYRAWSCRSAQWWIGNGKAGLFSFSGAGPLQAAIRPHNSKGRHSRRLVREGLNLATAHWWLPMNYFCHIILFWLFVPIKKGKVWPRHKESMSESVRCHNCQKSRKIEGSRFWELELRCVDKLADTAESWGPGSRIPDLPGAGSPLPSFARKPRKNSTVL